MPGALEKLGLVPQQSPPAREPDVLRKLGIPSLDPVEVDRVRMGAMLDEERARIAGMGPSERVAYQAARGLQDASGLVPGRRTLLSLTTPRTGAQSSETAHRSELPAAPGFPVSPSLMMPPSVDLRREASRIQSIEDRVAAQQQAEHEDVQASMLSRIGRTGGSVAGLLGELALTKRVVPGAGIVPGAVRFGTQQAGSNVALTARDAPEDVGQAVRDIPKEFGKGVALDLALRGVGSSTRAVASKTPVLRHAPNLTASVATGAGLGAAHAPEGERLPEAIASGTVFGLIDLWTGGRIRPWLAERAAGKRVAAEASATRQAVGDIPAWAKPRISPEQRSAEAPVTRQEMRPAPAPVAAPEPAVKPRPANRPARSAPLDRHLQQLHDDAFRSLTETRLLELAKEYRTKPSRVMDAVAEEFGRRQGVILPRGKKGMRETLFSDLSPQETKMYGGLGIVAQTPPLGKAAREMIPAAKEALLEPALHQRRMQRFFEETLKPRASYALRQFPKVREALGLPSPDQKVREVQRFAQRLSERGGELGARFDRDLKALSPAQQLEFWRAAERYETLPDSHPFGPLLSRYQSTVRAAARAMERGGVLPKDVIAKREKPGEQGYVRRIPGDAMYQKNLETSFKGLARQIAGVMARPTNFQYRNTGISGIAKAVAKDIESVTKARKDLSPAEAEAAGYMTGIGPVLKGLSQQVPIRNTMLVMERVLRDFGPKDRKGGAREGELVLVRDPVPAEMRTSADKKNWKEVKGKEWGVLAGKEVHKSLLGDLELMVKPQRSGFMDFLAAVNEWEKESVTTFSAPRFQMKQMVLENPLVLNLHGLPFEYQPLRFKQAVAALIAARRTGKLDPWLEALDNAGLLKRSAIEMEVREGGSAARVSDFRDLSGGRRYLPEFGRRAMRVFSERQGIASEALQQGRISEGRFGGGGAWKRGAEAYRALRDIVAGFDPVKAAGGRIGVPVSGEGLRDAASAVDAIAKYSLLRHLTETGGSSLMRQAVRKAAGMERIGTKSSLRDGIQVVRDAYDPTRIAPIIKTISRTPVVGYAFIRYPSMLTRNIFLKGYGARNPLGAALAWAPAAVQAGMFATFTGLSMELIDQYRLQAANGDEERAKALAPLYVERDERGNVARIIFADYAAVSTGTGIRGLHSPAESVSPRAGEPYPSRVVRGMVQENPMGSGAYRTLTGVDPYTGRNLSEERPKSGAEAGLESWPARLLPFARNAGQVAADVRKQAEAKERGEAPRREPWQTAMRALTGISTTTGYNPESPEGARRQSLVDYILSKRVQAESDLRTRQTLVRPEPPPEDATEEEIAKYLDDLLLYRSATRRGGFRATRPSRPSRPRR